MPFTSTTHSSASSALPDAARRPGGNARSPWLRLAAISALLAIGVQILVMAQLAQHQVQRGVQLRQALAAEKAERAAVAGIENGTPLRSAAVVQGNADSLPAYVLH